MERRDDDKLGFAIFRCKRVIALTHAVFSLSRALEAIALDVATDCGHSMVQERKQGKFLSFKRFIFRLRSAFPHASFFVLRQMST